mgnify:CR=1 FL=1
MHASSVAYQTCILLLYQFIANSHGVVCQARTYLRKGPTKEANGLEEKE